VNVKTFLLCSFCSAFSAGAALWLAPHRAGAERAPAPSALGSASAPTRPAQNVANLAAISRVVRAEIDGALGRHASAEESRRSAVPAVVPDPVVSGENGENVVEEFAEPTDAFVESKRNVSESITRGVWTEEDQKNVSASLARMSPAERREIMGEVIRAVNRGALKVDADNVFM
jgi:hypothetical protein